MRIAYLINSLEGGGAAAPIPALVGIMRSQGCEVRVLALTGRDRRGLPAIEQQGVPVAIRDGGERDHIAALRWLDREMIAWSPDLIWTSLTRATLLGQIVGQRRHTDVVSWQHNAFLKPANAFLLRLRRKRSLMWIADSDNVATLTHQKLGVARDRIAIWPLFAADPQASQATPWRRGEPLRIGSLGRLHRNKGYDVLITALTRLKAGGFKPAVPVEIDIGGEGQLRAALSAQAATAGLHDIHFVGFKQAGSFLAGLHLYVQPSRAEGLCIAAHEAMQAGLPVLASAVGELSHSIVDHVTGLIVPPGDPEKLADAIAALWRNPEKLAAMGAAARERVLARFGIAAFRAAGTDAIERIRCARANGLT